METFTLYVKYKVLVTYNNGNIISLNHADTQDNTFFISQ